MIQLHQVELKIKLKLLKMVNFYSNKELEISSGLE